MDIGLGGWIYFGRTGNGGCSFWERGHCALVFSGFQDSKR